MLTFSPASGWVTLNGEPIAQLKNRQRAAAIGVLFQEAENQIFHSNVAQEVAFGLKLQRLSAEEISRRTQAALRLYLNTGWRHAGHGEPASSRLAMTLRLPGVIFHGWYGWKTAGCQRENKKRVAEATRFMPY